jgi:peptide/nickel transport system ATP-binding protein
MALMDSLPQMEKDVEMLYSIDGQPPDLRYTPPGCNFAPRCSKVMDICNKEYPSISAVNDLHTYSCWLAKERN